jgi:hypothetical protein
MSVHSTRHPFSGALYELADDGTVIITDGERRGVFDAHGRWLSGDVEECDPQLCVWVANNPETEQPPASDSHLAVKERRIAPPDW